ncbi:MAG TPA: hypothetical protein VFG95_10710 [Nitrospiria bacterium]|nr:hypothetical protein [Nitrospiria bacterium]
MKLKLSVLILAIVLSTPILSLACSSLGPNIHAGVIRGVDSKEGTITLIDSETGKALTFSASEAQISPLRPNERVVIKFSVEGEKMVAKEIQA